MEISSSYRGKRVLVTGGLGFIGSNLVRNLVRLEASVTVIDACYPDQGANFYNLKDQLEKIDLVVADIGEADKISERLLDQEIVFNLAACTSHVGSLLNPVQDLERNCVSQLKFLNLLADLSPGSMVIYTGSRSQYGSPLYLPVDENHPLRPVDNNGVHKTTVEEYHRVFHEQKRLRCTSLRLTNVFGPRHQMHHDGQGFLNWFIREGLFGHEILVYGDGTQQRDFLYVDDVVEALLLAGASEACAGKVFNLASGRSITVAEAAQAVAEATGTTWRKVPFPPEYASVEPGDIVLDASLFREALGWEPRWDLQAGLMETIVFYRQNGRHYFRGQEWRTCRARKR